MHVRQPDRPRIAGRFVGREPHDEHLIRVAAKELAMVADAAALATDPRHGLVDVQVSPVIHRTPMVGQVHEKITESLVCSHLAVITGGVLIARPQTILIELDLLARNAAEDHCAHAAVADRQGFFHPPAGWAAIPQAHRSRRRRSFACKLLADRAGSVEGQVAGHWANRLPRFGVSSVSQMLRNSMSPP